MSGEYANEILQLHSSGNIHFVREFNRMNNESKEKLKEVT